MNNSELPPGLISAVEQQSAVLFLGAAASFGATHPKGFKIPSGDQLRDMLSDNFLGGKLKEKPLSAVAEYSISETSIVVVQEYIKEFLKGFEPADFHLLIPTFRWHGIVGTNFDIIIEKAYAGASNPLQELVPFVKNGQPIETQMKKTVDGIQYLKLHGCINHYTDRDIPLILATEQYARYQKNRSRLFERFKDWGVEFPVIFCGYSLSDPHVQSIMYELFDNGHSRPMYFAVDPKATDVEVRFWASHRITIIPSTFEAFLYNLDKAISPTSRKLKRSIGGGTSTLRLFYKVKNAPETEALLSFLHDDFEHIRPGMPTITCDPKEFYKGSESGWGPIEQNLDVSRSVTDNLVVDAILASEDERPNKVELYVVKGAAGNGKTIVIKRAAWMSANDYGKLVLFMRPGGAIRLDVIDEIFQNTGERIFLFVDRAAFYVDDIKNVLDHAKRQEIKLTAIVAERDAEWNVRCESLERYGAQEYPVRYLSEKEIRELLLLLEKHSSLGLLAELDTFEKRFEKLKGGAQRQLLVALHEATYGKAFEDIVFDEYHRIIPNEAQSLYLDICTLNRLGVSVRSGLISRVSGISFTDFQRRLFKPLEHIVRAYYDKYIGDNVYDARHQHVAEMVFDRVLPEPEQRFDQIIRIMGGMNLDYSSDHEAFSQLVRGHSVSEALRSRELGRAFFEAAQRVAPDEAFLAHQRGIFEMETGGNLAEADRFLSIAHDKEPFNKSIQHSQAVLCRKLALQTQDSLLRQRLREKTRAILRPLLGETASTSHGYHTAAQIALDDLKDVLTGFSASDSDQMTERRIVELSKDFEHYLQEGLQRFPQNQHLLSLEASYRSLADEHAKAEVALKKAFAANPRQEWIAIRLSKTLEQAGKTAEVKPVLTKCLHENPTSKRVHFEIAMYYMRHPEEGNDQLIYEHLRRSFTTGDQNYEAQYWFARAAFLRGEFLESKQLFKALSVAQIPTDLKNKVRGVIADTNGKSRIYVGDVVTFESTYLFVKCPEFEENIFVHRSRSSLEDWWNLRRGSRVTMTLGFNMRGFTAESIELVKRNGS